MRKLFITVVLAVFCLFTAEAQKGDSGLVAGYTSAVLKAKASYEGESESESESTGGFYIGVFKEIPINEKMLFNIELQYANYFDDGESDSSLLLPLLFKYKASEDLGLLFGPQLDYLFNDELDLINQLGLGLAIGAQYDLSEKIYVQAKYSFGVTERLTDDEVLEPIEFDSRLDFFNVGLGYRF